MNTLSPHIRRKAEWISVICGTIGGLLANIERSNRMVVWIVLASLVAGAVGNISADAGEDPGLRPRAGIRAGVLTAVIAGAVAVLGFTIRSPIAGFIVALPALLAIPPGAFFGMLGSLVISMIQNPPVRPLGALDVQKRGRPSVLLITILIGSIMGYLSPIIAVILPAAAPRVGNLPTPPAVAPPTPEPTRITAPAPTPPPTSRQPPPPPWKYETPAGFADAHPSQFGVLKEVSLGPYHRPFRFAFAKDGHTFAFARSDTSVTVLDSNEPETTFSWSVPEAPDRLAFSPDGTRLFCITVNGAKMVLSKERSVRLPRPAGALNGAIEWAENKRVTIGDKVLDLDTLRLSSASEARSSVRTASPPRIQLRSGQRIFAVQDSRLQTQTMPFIADLSRDYSVLAPATTDMEVLSPDATKLFFAREGNLSVTYLGLRASRETKLTADVKVELPASASDALKAHRLIALLCPTIINPLNDKPIDADLSRVSAVLGVESWEGGTANLYVKEDYGMKVDEGDAVAMLLDTGHGRTVTVEGFENWWSVVRKVSAGYAPDLTVSRGAPPAKSDESPKAPVPPVGFQNVPMSDQKANQLRAFIEAHHAKSSRSDVDGLVADYADKVDHFNNGFVDRNFIRKDEADYHSPGTRVTETVVTPPTFRQLGPTSYAATYTIAYHRIRPDGKWTKGLSDISLTLEFTPGGPRIVRQRAQNRNQTKSP